MHEIYHASLPEVANKLISIPKSEAVQLRLKEIALSGFSPSALTSYIRNPIQFYFQKILRLKEVDEVEENIAVNTLGTIIHETLKALYEPFIGKIVTEINIDSCIKKIDTEVLQQFKLVYKEGEIKRGRNLLAFEVAKRNVFNFLTFELNSIKKGEVMLPFRIMLVGGKYGPGVFAIAEVIGKEETINRMNATMVAIG